MTDEDRIYQELLINDSKEKIPNGWGRTSIGGKVIVTKPSKKKAIESGPGYELIEDDFTDLHLDEGQLTEEASNDEFIDSMEAPDDYALISDSFVPDSKGFIGSYHIDDLRNQFSELKNRDKMSDRDLYELLGEISQDNNNVESMDPRNREANRFLEYSIRGGLSK